MHYLRILAIMLIAAGCTSHPAVVNEKKDSKVSKVLYRLDSAVENITSFDSLSREYLDDSIPVKAFTIRAEDLLDAMGMSASLVDSASCKYKHIRVYLAYRPRVGFKLFIVPVKGAHLEEHVAGEDMLLDSTGQVVHNKGLAAQKLYVLDLNAPCPNTCAQNSPLSPK
jgi:hypothetical protein